MTGDLKLGLLKDEKSQYSQDFQLALQSSFVLPTIDKPTCVHKMSASLIDNISFNNPNQILTSGKIITDVCDQFSQFCILTSGRDKITKRETKQNKTNKTTKQQRNANYQTSPQCGLIMICPQSTGIVLQCQKQIAFKNIF